MDFLIYEQEGRPVPVPGLLRLSAMPELIALKTHFKSSPFLQIDSYLVVAMILWSWNDKVARLEDDDR